MLIAAELTKLSPISIIGYLYYPMILGIVALLSILLRYPKTGIRKQRNQEKRLIFLTKKLGNLFAG